MDEPLHLGFRCTTCGWDGELLPGPDEDDFLCPGCGRSFVSPPEGPPPPRPIPVGPGCPVCHKPYTMVDGGVYYHGDEGRSCVS